MPLDPVSTAQPRLLSALMRAWTSGRRPDGAHGRGHGIQQLVELVAQLGMEGLLVLQRDALLKVALRGAFGRRWGIGLLVGPLLAFGLDTATAYRAAFGVMFLMQAAAYAWFVVEGKRRRQ